MERKKELEVLIPVVAKDILHWAESIKRVNAESGAYSDYSYIDIIKSEITTLEGLKREYQLIIESKKS